MNRDHRAQLLVCHERIAVGGQGAMDRPADWARAAKQYCDLGAYAWCYECDRYVCRTHLYAKHERHDYEVEFPTLPRSPAGQSAGGA